MNFHGGHELLRVLQFFAQAIPLRLQFLEPSLDAFHRERSIGEERDEAILLSGHLDKPALDLAGALGRAVICPALLGEKSSQIFLRCFGLLQEVEHAVDHAGLDAIEAVGFLVVARSAFGIAGAANADGAAVHPLGAHAPAALAAAKEAGKDPFRLVRPPMIAVGDGPIGFPLLDSLKDISRHDRKVRGFRKLPFLGWVLSAHTLAGIRIADHRDAVPNDLAIVERVLQDAVGSALVAIDGARIPLRAPRRKDAVRIQAPRDLPGVHPAEIHFEDAANNGGLLFIDRPLARLPGDEIVAIGVAACRAAVGDDPGHPTPDLMLKIGKEHGAKQAADADLHRIGDPFMDGDNLDTAERQPLEDTCQIFLIARYAIERLDHDDIKIAVPGIRHELHYPVAADQRRARLRPVRIDAASEQAVSPRIFPAKCHLIVNRSIFLEVRRVPGVEDRSLSCG
nr:hypothetical protein [Rhizobium subbaraonis]